MKCPKCHAENPDTSRFCGNCATSLTSAKAVSPSLTKTLESPAYVVAPGTVIAGHYEVLEKLGQGGMGEVYRAVDKNLGRQVAIKILPEEFSTDPERLARFEREAKLLATLNHPNIAAIYGFEEAVGRRFLALELVEGETLQRRLDRGALPVDEALDMCRQVAEGLEAAHERGVVHRDLKPGNIMITPEGKVKILDFGLAKACGGEMAGVDIEKSPTITAQMTEPGVILGTAAYMSPEQARGRAVDRRSDIWAFGCILYECLTGKRAFHGDTVSDTLAHILKGEPDWNALPVSTPWSVTNLLHRCLRKEHKNRLRDIGDVRIEIEEALRSPATAERTGKGIPARTSRLVIALFVLISLAAVAAITALLTRMWDRQSLSPRSAVRIEIGTEPAKQIAERTGGYRPNRTSLAVSPDGDSIIFAGVGEKNPQLYIRALDKWAAVPIAGTEGGCAPFLSPDGRWVGFWADGNLKKVPIGGGTPVILCEEPDFGACWGSDDMIIYSQGDSLMRVPSGGGKAEVLIAPDRKKGEIACILPHVLPGGDAVLFTMRTSLSDWENPRIEVLSLKSNQRKLLLDEGADARYVTTGHLVFLRQGTLCAAPFDASRLTVTGPVVQLVENVMQATNAISPGENTFAGQFAFSSSGALAYISGGPYPDLGVWLLWIDRNGNAKPVLAAPGPYFWPRVSPDGKRVAYCSEGKRTGIWVADIERGISMPLTNGYRDWGPIWTPDNKRVAFTRAEASGRRKIMWMPADGSGEAESLLESETGIFASSWSPKGDLLAYLGADPATGHSSIWVLRLKDRKSDAFLRTRFNVSSPELSPDGHWMAYDSDEAGQSEVYVQPYPGPGQKIRVSSEGGWAPCWGPGGRQLYYLGSANYFMYYDNVMVVDIATTPAFSAGPPRLVLDYLGYGLLASPTRGYDIHPDGQRFLGWGYVYGGKPIRRSDLPEDLLLGLENGDDRSLVRFGYWLKMDGQRKVSPDWEGLDQKTGVTQIKFIQNWFEELKRLVPAGKK